MYNVINSFVLGICGGSASGKTTVATKIIESLDVPWVTLLSMDSFYKVWESYKYYCIKKSANSISNFSYRF